MHSTVTVQCDSDDGRQVAEEARTNIRAGDRCSPWEAVTSCSPVMRSATTQASVLAVNQCFGGIVPNSTASRRL